MISVLTRGVLPAATHAAIILDGARLYHTSSNASLDCFHMSHSNAWATRCLLCKSGPFTRSELPNDALAISRPTSRSSDAITEEIVKPQHEPVADPGDADPTNTRIFIKSLSPNLLTYEEVYKTFRYFGKIKMIALQTKRHNVLVEFETHVRNVFAPSQIENC